MSSLPLIIIGADHGGFSYKEKLKTWLSSQNFELKDCGAYQLDPLDDYPQFAGEVARALLQTKNQGINALGILLCRSGGGMTIAANRVAGIRAVAAVNTEMARHGKAHNNANILVLSGDWTEFDLMQRITQTFIDTPFSQEAKHVRRLAQLETINQQIK